MRPSSDDQALFGPSARRRTYRKPLEERELPHELVNALQRAAEVEGARLQLVRSVEARSGVIELVSEGNRVHRGVFPAVPVGPNMIPIRS